MDQESDDNEENENNKNDLFNCVFIFSCILPDFFLMIKNLISPNFIQENISLNGLTDLIINMREDIGTTLKVENDDENKIFGVFTLIPFQYYKSNPVTTQIINMLKSKVQEISDNNKKFAINNILSNNRLALLINERFLNLPEPLVPPSLNFIINEMNECIDIAKDEKDISEQEKNKYKIDYVIIYSRFVIKENKDHKYEENNYINLVVKEKTFKKPKLEDKNEISYYKYEIEYFDLKADYSFEYDLTGGIYDSSSWYFDKNNNEKQYMKIIFINLQKFCEIVQELNKI